MRGSVPGQVAGALAAWRTRYPHARAIVCPAYPRMGRTVESNRLLVNGEPVERTSFGRDPVTPVATSDMAQLLPAIAAASVVDAATDTDLMAIAAAISSEGPSVIPVGSGGLAEALAEVLATRAESAGNVRLLDRRSLGEGGQPDHGIFKKTKNARILLQVSSLNPVSHAQVARLEAAFPDVAVLSAPRRERRPRCRCREPRADICRTVRTRAVGHSGVDWRRRRTRGAQRARRIGHSNRRQPARRNSPRGCVWWKSRWNACLHQSRGLRR